MNKRIDIVKELEALQSPLAGQVPENVFTVPAGYFDGLAASVLRAVQGETILQAMQPPASAHVPEGYFENLAGNILNKIKAQHNDEEPLSPLLESLRNTNVFTVPQGYFEGLAHDILNKARPEHNEEVVLSPLLESLRSTNVFTVPQGYFEGLGEDILAGQSTADQPLHPLLEGLRQQQVFTVPQGYFEALPTQIAAKVQVPKGKLVGFMRSRFVKYAAAAVVAGVMALGVYQLIGKGAGDTNPPALAALTDIQKKGIELSKNEAAYNSELESVSGEAIVQFLTANGDDLETALAAAAVNESELPSEDDLMLDDAALEDFFNSDEKKATN